MFVSFLQILTVAASFTSRIRSTKFPIAVIMTAIDADSRGSLKAIKVTILHEFLSYWLISVWGLMPTPKWKAGIKRDTPACIFRLEQSPSGVFER